MELENLAKVNRNSRCAFLATLILIAAAAIYNWLVAPHVGNVLAAQQYIDTLDAVTEKGEVLQKITVMKKKKLVELHEQMTKLQSLFFTDRQAKEFFNDLQTISLEQNCKLNSIVIDSKRPDSSLPKKQDLTIRTYSIEMEVIGSYSEIVSLIKRLLERTQNVSINSLEMKTFEGDFSKIKCMMTLIIYTLQGEEALLNE